MGPYDSGSLPQLFREKGSYDLAINSGTYSYTRNYDTFYKFTNTDVAVSKCPPKETEFNGRVPQSIFGQSTQSWG